MPPPIRSWPGDIRYPHTAVYFVPVVPLLLDAAMVMAPLAVADVPLESTTLAVMFAAVPLTAVVGVPVMAPVVEFSVRPAGSLPVEIE